MRLVRDHVRLAAVAAGLLMLASPAPAQAPGAPAPAAAPAAGSAEKGKAAFMKYGCWQCHGTVGQGSPISGPKLAPAPMPLEAMASFIRNSRRAMPPYREEVLPNSDLADIHAYLSSVKAAPIQTRSTFSRTDRPSQELIGLRNRLNIRPGGLRRAGDVYGTFMGARRHRD